MFQGKNKAITFSYDDGAVQDIRLIELLNRYGLKATFNLNSGLLGGYNRVPQQDVAALYAGHEIAAHTLTHPDLLKLGDEAVFREVEEDRLRLSELGGGYPAAHRCALFPHGGMHPLLHAAEGRSAAAQPYGISPRVGAVIRFGGTVCGDAVRHPTAVLHLGAQLRA